MKKLKIRKVILPGIYILLIVSSFLVINLVNNKLFVVGDDNDYSTSIMKDFTQNVLEEAKDDVFTKPFLNDGVSVLVSYYDSNSAKENQEQSLIYYEKTYMPSTGVLYTLDTEFDVVAVYDGTVTKVGNDDILGDYVEVTHNDNLISYYYSIKDITICEGDEIKTGTILGKSATSKLSEKPSLFFEVYFQGKSINPEDFYLNNPNDYR